MSIGFNLQAPDALDLDKRFSLSLEALKYDIDSPC